MNIYYFKTKEFPSLRRESACLRFLPVGTERQVFTHSVQICGPDAFPLRACTVLMGPLNAPGCGGHIDMRMSLCSDRSVVM